MTNEMLKKPASFARIQNGIKIAELMGELAYPQLEGTPEEVTYALRLLAFHGKISDVLITREDTSESSTIQSQLPRRVPCK